MHPGSGMLRRTLQLSASMERSRKERKSVIARNAQDTELSRSPDPSQQASPKERSRSPPPHTSGPGVGNHWLTGVPVDTSAFCCEWGCFLMCEGCGPPAATSRRDEDLVLMQGDLHAYSCEPSMFSALCRADQLKVIKLYETLQRAVRAASKARSNNNNSSSSNISSETADSFESTVCDDLSEEHLTLENAARAWMLTVNRKRREWAASRSGTQREPQTPR